jgi:hypothetical protein
VTATILILIAAALAISGVTAQSKDRGAKTKEQIRRYECKDWPSDTDKPTVATAFDIALQTSAINTPPMQARRGRLLDPSKAQKEIEDIMANELQKNIKFPPHSEVRFYEPDTLATPPSCAKVVASYPSDQCYHIFFLPEIGQQDVKANRVDNLMCCYIPWKTQ